MTDPETLQRYLDEAPLHGFIGDLTVQVDGATLSLEGTLHPEVVNGADTATAHGGALATLLDTALTFALIAETDRDWSPVDLRLDYLRPVGLGTVHVQARVVRAGRRTGLAEGRLTDATGQECVRAIGTFAPVDR